MHNLTWRFRHATFIKWLSFECKFWLLYDTEKKLRPASYILYIISNPCISIVFIATILGNDAQIHVCINGMTMCNMKTFPSFYFKNFQIIYINTTLVFQTTEACPVIHLANLCKNASQKSLQSYGIYSSEFSRSPSNFYFQLHNGIRVL
jgi:hypothetical protein